MFDLIREGDENKTDEMCNNECQSQIGGGNNGGILSISDIIGYEVISILHNDPHLSVEHCATKCDSMFELIAHDDEHKTDDMCRKSCECVVRGDYDHGHCRE